METAIDLATGKQTSDRKYRDIERSGKKKQTTTMPGHAKYENVVHSQQWVRQL